MASDLDLLLAVHDEDHAAFAGAWRGWLAGITPTVVARSLPSPPGSFSCVTPTCERLDVVVEAAGAVAASPFRHRMPVLDRDGLDAVVRPRRPSPVRTRSGWRGWSRSSFRQQVNLPTVTVRDNWLLGVVAVQ